MSELVVDVTEVLDPAKGSTAVVLSSPGQTVIDNDTGTITFEHKSAAWMLADATAAFNDAKDLVPLIDSPAMYTEAGEVLKKLTDSHKTLDEERLSTTLPLRDRVEQINAAYNPAINKRKEAAELVKQGMLTFQQEEDRKRREAERQAALRAEEERRRAAAEAAAAKRRAQEEADAARRAGEEKAALERTQAETRASEMRREADELDAAGNVARAAQLRSEANELLGIADEVAQTAMFDGEQAAAAATTMGALEAESFHAVAEMITPAAVSRTKVKASGVSTSYKYRANVVDKKALVAYIVANWDTCQHLLVVQQGQLDTLAQNQKEMFTFAGCELVKETVMSARRK